MIRQPDHKDIVITGLGMVSALGLDAKSNLKALRRGHSGIRRITHFSTDHLDTDFAGLVAGSQQSEFVPLQRTDKMARLAIAQAMTCAQLQRPVRDQIPLILALPPIQVEWSQRLELSKLCTKYDRSSVGLVRHLAHDGVPSDYKPPTLAGSAKALADDFGCAHYPAIVNTACSSGATAIILAVEAMRREETDCMIVVAADASITPEMLLRFGKLQALSTRRDNFATASRPFDKDRDGFVPGEGAGALVIETRERAERRGAQALAKISGVADLTDGYHRLRHTPDASRIVDVMHAALDNAHLKANEISCIKAHGTSTQENDLVEALGCNLVFGRKTPPVTALKSMIGHTLSASGLLELAMAVQMLRNNVIFPTINRITPDPNIKINLSSGDVRTVPLSHIICNSFGFGGQNASICISATRESS